MIIIGQRVIEYLSGIQDITDVVGDNIFCEGYVDTAEAELRIEVDMGVGLDENATPTDSDIFNITILANRSITDAHFQCLELAKLVDSFVDRKERELTNDSIKVLNFTRQNSSGLRIDDTSQEYWYVLTYSYLIENNQ